MDDGDRAACGRSRRPGSVTSGAVPRLRGPRRLSHGGPRGCGLLFYASGRRQPLWTTRRCHARPRSGHLVQTPHGQLPRRVTVRPGFRAQSPCLPRRDSPLDAEAADGAVIGDDYVPQRHPIKKCAATRRSAGNRATTDTPRAIGRWNASERAEPVDAARNAAPSQRFAAF